MCPVMYTHRFGVVVCSGGLSGYSKPFCSTWNLTRLTHYLRIGKPTGSCTGSTETRVTGGSTGSEDKDLVGGSTVVSIGLELDCACSSSSAAVAQKLRCRSSSVLRNTCFSAVSRMSRRFFRSTLPLADSTLYERGCWHFSTIRPGSHR